MLAPDTTRTLTIKPSAPLMLEQAIGARLTVLRGELWLTQYGDARDIVLKPGQHFRVELPGCLLTACAGEVEVVLRQPEPARAARPAARPASRRWLPLRWNTATHP